MIAARGWNGDDEELIMKVERLKEQGVKEENIMFPTSNFNTFIHDAGKAWWISTCNNHPFREILANTGKPIVETEKIPSKDHRYDLILALDWIEFYMEDEYDFVELVP
jgi:hypothetical protein